MAIKNYIVRDSNTVLDVVSTTLGNFDNTYTFITSNDIASLNEDLSVGEILSYDNVLVNFTQPNLYLTPTVINNKKMIKTHDKQSIYDICLQKYGNLDDLLYFVNENNFLNIDDVDCKLKDVIIDVAKYTPELNKKFNLHATLSTGLIEEYGYILLNTGGYVLLNINGRIKR